MCRHRITLCILTLVVLGLTACSTDSGEPTAPGAPTTDRIRIGSFEFAESRLLAELYSQALEHGGFPVERKFDLGPREFVAPALANGLVDLVPEYAGAALEFLSLGAVEPSADEAQTHRALVQTLERTPMRALAPSPAQDANAFVVTHDVAERHNLRSLSDVARVAPELTFGGPPECSSRPFCLLGLDRVYGLRFKEVVSLDAGGPVTLQALDAGAVQMALLFTTDPALRRSDVVELADDRGLRPADNVTPLVRADTIDRAGPRLAELVDAVSKNLTTDALRNLNGRLAAGTDVAEVAAAWLTARSLR